MSEINRIWFDLGYTLIKQNREFLLHDYLKELGYNYPSEEIDKAYHYSDKLYMKNKRDYPEAFSYDFYRKYFSNLIRFLELYLSSDQLAYHIRQKKTEKALKWYCFNYTHGTLCELKKHGFSLGLISNWDLSARSVLKQNELTGYFDYIVISAEIGHEKPSREIFEHALELSGDNPENCLYIGDNYYDDVVGSSKVSMKSLLINRFGHFGIEEISHNVISGIHDLPRLLLNKQKSFFINSFIYPSLS